MQTRENINASSIAINVVSVIAVCFSAIAGVKLLVGQTTLSIYDTVVLNIVKHAKNHDVTNKFMFKNKTLNLS